MTRKQAEARVVRAAMRWFNHVGFMFDAQMKVNYPKDAVALENACDALSAALARKEKK